jgi:hypothetical protein
METKARFIELQNQIITDEIGCPLNGEKFNFFGNNEITVFKDGLLHSENKFAISCEDPHEEYWKNGKIHREGKPAIVSEGGRHCEYWNEGVLYRILCSK